MIELERQFLFDSARRLARLEEDLDNQNIEALRREALRAAHTVKGGAQVFGYEESARAAHRLEDLLSRDRAGDEAVFRRALAEGLAALAASLEENKKISAAASEESEAARTRPGATETSILSTNIPAETLRRLSAAEKSAVRRALGRGASFYAIEAGFAPARFAADYKRLSDALGEAGEVIAALPGRRFEAEGKIGFRFLLASDETLSEIERRAEEFSGVVVSFGADQSKTGATGELFSKIVAHGRELASAAGKTIAFGVLATDSDFSEKLRPTIFEALLHLVRNAVDHGIENAGRVEIEFFAGRESLHLAVADDGRGIDTDEIRRRAAALGLVDEPHLLTDEQARQLVFAPGLSTAASVSSVSGRGVGLDAVRESIEAAGGKISVRSRKDKGAVFEIDLPA